MQVVIFFYNFIHKTNEMNELSIQPKTLNVGDFQGPKGHTRASFNWAYACLILQSWK